MVSREDCIESLRVAASAADGILTKAQYEAGGYRPSAATVLRKFGSWNDAKRAAGLDVNPSSGTRVEPKPPDVEIPDGESWADLTADQRWHYRNVTRNTQRTLDRRRRTRLQVYRYKREVCTCEYCGEGDPACLDFHHVDESEKDMAVGRMITYGYAADRVFEEIEKCKVLCANCHRKEHYEPPTPQDEFGRDEAEKPGEGV